MSENICGFYKMAENIQTVTVFIVTGPQSLQFEDFLSTRKIVQYQGGEIK